MVKKNDSSRQIRYGALISYSAIVLNIIAGLLYTPWMVQSIGQSHYGLFILSTSLINLFLLDFGLSASVSRFVSKYNAEKNLESINNLLGIIYKLYIIIDLLILMALIVIFFMLDIIYANLTPDEIEAFKVVYTIAAIFSVFSFPFTTLNGILIGYEKFIYLKVCDLFNKLFIVVLMVFAILAGFGLYTLVTVNAISGLTTIVIKLIIIKRNTPISVNFKFKSKTTLKEIFSFSIWATIGGLAGRFIFSTTPTILGITSSTINIAVFGVASIIEGYIFTIANALNGLFLPKVSRIINNPGQHTEILPLMIKVGRIQFTMIGLLTIGFISLGREFMEMWMGNDFIESYYCAVALILPALFSLPQEIANTTAVAANKVKQQSFVYLSMAVINIPLSVVLSNQYGAFGASLAISISFFYRTICMNILYYRVLKIDVFTFFKECYAKMVLPIIITIILAFVINPHVITQSWIVFISKGIILVGIYMSLMWIMSFNSYEKNLIRKLFKKIKTR